MSMRDEMMDNTLAAMTFFEAVINGDHTLRDEMEQAYTAEDLRDGLVLSFLLYLDREEQVRETPLATLLTDFRQYLNETVTALRV